MGSAIVRGSKSEGVRSRTNSDSDSTARSSINGAAACDLSSPPVPAATRSMKKVSSQSVVIVHVEPLGEDEPSKASIAARLQGLLQTIDDGLTLDPSELREGLSLALTALSDAESTSDHDSEVLSSVSNTQVRAWLATTFTREEQVAPPPHSPLTPKERFKAIANIIIIGKYFENIYKDSVTSSGPSCPPEAATILREELDMWEFPIFHLRSVAGGEVLRVVGFELFKHYNLFERCSICPSLFDSFLTQIEIDYGIHGNPYHNATHGADVAQTVHYFISQTGLQDNITHLDIMSLLFSALIHDVNHPGTTNNFQIASKSQLALLYSDRSVLEYHHLYHTFKLMQEERFNIFSALSSEDYKLVRGLIVEMVLGTDMSFHFLQTKSMRQTLSCPNTSAQMLTTERAKTFAYILHVADISHPAKRWAEHLEWSDRVCEEFFCQGDREKSLGLAISPLCGRHDTNLPDSQLGFIEYIVNPSFEVTGLIFDAIADQSPNSPCKAKSHDEKWVWLTKIESNKAEWKARKEEENSRQEKAEQLAGHSASRPEGGEEGGDEPEKSELALESDSSSSRGTADGGEDEMKKETLSSCEQRKSEGGSGTSLQSHDMAAQSHDMTDNSRVDSEQNSVFSNEEDENSHSEKRPVSSQRKADGSNHKSASLKRRPVNGISKRQSHEKIVNGTTELNDKEAPQPA